MSSRPVPVDPANPDLPEVPPCPAWLVPRRATFAEGHHRSHLTEEDGGHLAADGVIDGAALFPIRHANLLRGAEGLDIGGLTGRLRNGEDPLDFVAATGDPDRAMDAETVIFLCPAGTAAEGVTALPNGYFAGDLTPFELLTLARHLETAHGLRLFGIGAPLVAFVTDAPLSAAGARRVADDLAPLYADAALTDRLCTALTGRDALILTYTGG